MNAAAISVLVYGIYLFANGVGLLCAPNIPLGLLGLPPTQEPWVRVLGLVAGEVGFYFAFAALRGVAGLFRATVHARGVAGLTLIALMVLGLGPVQLSLFAAVDLASAFWTHLAIRRSDAARPGLYPLKRQDTP